MYSLFPYSKFAYPGTISLYGLFDITLKESVCTMYTRRILYGMLIVRVHLLIVLYISAGRFIKPGTKDSDRGTRQD